MVILKDANLRHSKGNLYEKPYQTPYFNIFANISAASGSLSLQALCYFHTKSGRRGATTYESQAPEIFAEQVSKKLGTFDIIAILTSSDEAHIDSVTEVYSVIENAKV